MKSHVLGWALGVALGLPPTAALAQQHSGDRPIHFTDFSFEELLTAEIKSASGLTETNLRRVPVSLMELDADVVKRSGARDVNHLLEMYVPNVQLIDHHHLQSHLGFRGIISDREDKYLFQVNGRTMNNRMFVGADNERALPLLGDIQKVSVVRGPASATHGAGALAGVINLTPYNGLTFEGSDVQLRQGMGDQFTAAEVRFGKRFNSRSGLFTYYGVADQPGSDSEYYLGASYGARNGLPAYGAGTVLQAPTARHGVGGFDQLRHKAHVSYVSGPFEVWTRFVQDGNESRPLREIYTTAKPDSLSLEDWVRGREFVNRQFTVTGTYTKALAPAWGVTLTQSFDRWAAEEQRMGTQLNAPARRTADEEELFSRGIVNWSPTSAHSVAFGSEYSREWFADPFVSDALDRAPVVSQREWSTHTASFLAEYQWKINPQWTSFVSARTDRHTYSDWLLSPRASLVYTPNRSDTWAFMVGKSVRRSIDSELWAQHVRLGTIPAPESLLSYEASYTRTMGTKLVAGASAFYEDYDAIGWVPALYLATSLGRFHIAGGELRATFTHGNTRIVVSEGLTQLVDSTVPAGSPAAGQAITAQPYGYGNDLANWARFITKAVVQHELSSGLTASTSVIHYSGFAGAKDYAAYASSTFSDPPSAIPVSDPGFVTPYGPNLFWTAGLDVRATDNWNLRLDGYNLVAPIDKTLSKRNYYFRLSEYNVLPASLSLSLRYRF
jgi:outer membrane receptor protein involved in Fe transport